MSGFKDFLRGEEPSSLGSQKTKLNNYDKQLQKKRLRLSVGDKTKNIELTRPKNFTEIQILIDKLRASDGIIVDFSYTEEALSQRMLDFLSGAVYALEGKVVRIEDSTYLMTPKNVKVVASLGE